MTLDQQLAFVNRKLDRALEDVAQVPTGGDRSVYDFEAAMWAAIAETIFILKDLGE
jgi:hypothetical protein